MPSLNPLTQFRAIPFGKVTRPAWVMIIGAGVNRLAAFLQIFLVLFLTTRGLSPVTAGLMLTGYGIGAIVGVLIGGVLVDRIGARASVVISMLITAASVALLPHVRPIPLLLVVCWVAGASAQLFRPAASVVIASEMAPGHVVAVMGIYRLSINIASAVGPLLGGLAYQWSKTSVFYLDAVTSLAFALVAVVWLRDRVGAPAADTPESSRRWVVLRDRRFCLVVLAQFVTSLVEVQYLTVLPLELQSRGWSPTVYTLVLALNGALVISCELIVLGLVSSVTIRTKVALGSGLIGIGLSLIGIEAGIILILLATVTWTLGEMLSAPGINAYPALIAPPGTAGRYYAALAAGQTGGYAAGPVIGAFVYEHSGSWVWVLCAVGGVLAWLGMRVGLQPVDAQPESAEAEQPAHSTADVLD